jgi:hypothetical protein
MISSNPLTESEVKRVVDDWYLKLDVHAPVEELLPMLATEGLEMVFPEATLTTIDGFKGWYHAVTNRFFDEVHEMKRLDIAPRGDEADVSLVVNWQAKIWNPPDAKSQWLGFDARQTWIVARAADGRVVVKKYVVDGLDPMPGSASL